MYLYNAHYKQNKGKAEENICNQYVKVSCHVIFKEAIQIDYNKCIFRNNHRGKGNIYKKNDSQKRKYEWPVDVEKNFQKVIKMYLLSFQKNFYSELMRNQKMRVLLMY